MVLPPFGCSYAITPSCKTALQYGDDAAMTSRKGFTTVDTYQRYMANKCVEAAVIIDYKSCSGLNFQHKMKLLALIEDEQ